MRPLTTLYLFTRPRNCPACSAWKRAGIDAQTLAAAWTFPVAEIDPTSDPKAQQLAAKLHVQSVPMLMLWHKGHAYTIATPNDGVPTLTAIAERIHEAMK